MDGFESSHTGLFQRAANLRMALFNVLQRGTLLIVARLDRLEGLQRLVVLWVAGGVALALVTLLCFQLGLDFATTAFVFLIVIVFLSLLDSLISSAIFSIIAVGCLNYFFVEPLHTLVVGDGQDLITLAAFLITSLAVTSLVRKVRGLSLSEEQIRHGESQLRAVINTVPVFVWSTLPSGDTDFQNQRLLSYAGVSPEKARGKGWMEMIHPDDVGRHGEVWAAAMEAGTSFECESRWRGSDGHYRWFLARAEPLRDDRGNIVKWYGTNVDIDDRKRAEEALRRSEAYLAEAQKLSRTGSFGWNVASREILWSGETFRIFEREPTETPSTEMVLERVHPEDRALVRLIFERAVEDGRDFNFEHRLLMRDGSVKRLHVVARGVTDEQGNLQFVGAVMDITAQREAYVELERSEQRYRHLFNHMPMALCQIDGSKLVELFKGLRAEGVSDLSAYFDAHPEFLLVCMEALVFEEVNEHGLKMFGASDAGEFIRQPIAAHWQVRPDTFRRAMQSRFEGEDNFQEETKVTTLDGRVIDVLFTASRLGTPGNLAKSLVGLIDIAQRVRVQEALHQLQADFAHAARISVLGELTASIAHEVNQPLAAIAVNAGAGLRWLNRPEPDLAEIRALAESIAADAARAADIIARVRAMAVRQVPEQARFSLDDIIREALLFLNHEAQSRAVTVLHYPAPAAPQILGDRTQLQQVIVNLAVNAMQAMAQAGSARRRIAISTDMHDPDTLRCTVQDSGPGVRPEHVPRLFESFFTTKDGGMGMGLPICRSIIEAHGGRIDADNGGTEGGARFSFTLPAATKPN